MPESDIHKLDKKWTMEGAIRDGFIVEHEVSDGRGHIVDTKITNPKTNEVFYRETVYTHARDEHIAIIKSSKLYKPPNYVLKLFHDVERNTHSKTLTPPELRRILESVRSPRKWERNKNLLLSHGLIKSSGGIVMLLGDKP